MFGGKIGPLELAVIVVIALLIFGPKKLGELGKGLGEGIRNFKSSMNDHNSTSNSNSTTTTEEKK
jgi:sec-independent protein translocase protein TatA